MKEIIIEAQLMKNYQLRKRSNKYKRIMVQFWSAV